MSLGCFECREIGGSYNTLVVFIPNEFDESTQKKSKIPLKKLKRKTTSSSNLSKRTSTSNYSYSSTNHTFSRSHTHS